MRLDISATLRASDPSFAAICDAFNTAQGAIEAQTALIKAKQEFVELLQANIATLKECMRLDATTIAAKDRRIAQLEAEVATLRAQASARSAA